MGSATEVDYCLSLRRLCSVSPDISKWSLFGGTCISSKFIEALVDVWANRYGLHFNYRSSVVAECMPEKQDFIRHQVKPYILVSDVAQLNADVATNLMTGSQSLLPYCMLMDGGVPCTSRTPLSSKSSQNANCVQMEQEATGRGFRDLCAAVAKHWPVAIVLECVVQLSQKVGSQQSDAEWMCQKLRSMGYWCHTDSVQASEWGAPGPRERQYWCALRTVGGNHQDISHYFNTVLTSFKQPCPMWPLESYFTLDDTKRAEEADKVGLTLHNAFGPRASKTLKESLNWKAEHKVLCDNNSIQWPVPIEVIESAINRSGLFPREQEAAYILHKFFPPPQTDALQFVDINPVVGRLLNSHMDDSDHPKPGNGPWRATLPTLTGSLKLLIRETKAGVSTVRTIDGLESMRLIGWCDSCWDPQHASNITEGGVEGLQLIENLAGNAFSIFHYGPWVCALLAALGKHMVCNTGDSQEPSELAGSSPAMSADADSDSQ